MEVKSMAYTPELYQRGSATLRRLAWFRGKPMSKTLETLLEATGRTMAEIRPGGREANSFFKKTNLRNVVEMG